MRLRDTIERLTSDFAEQVVAALRDASLEELAARSSRSAAATPPPRRSTAPRASSRTKSRPATRATPRAGDDDGATTQVVTALSAAVRSAALDILAERGRKGATEGQLSADLAGQGLPPVRDLMRLLAERGDVRDTGFRRASGGHTTAAVYVISDAAPSSSLAGE